MNSRVRVLQVIIFSAGLVSAVDCAWSETFEAIDRPLRTVPGMPTCFREFSLLATKKLPPVLKHKRFKEVTMDEADRLGVMPVFPEPQLAKVTDVVRIRNAAKVIDLNRPGSELANLEDGIYVWAIDNLGHLGFLERNMGVDPIGSGNKFLGSHEGLMRLFKSKFGRRTQFVATGEVVVRNGRVMVVDNASGSYPSVGENLAYGVEKLISRDLKIDERTQVNDLSKKITHEPHQAAWIQVPIEMKVMREPHLRALYDETRRVMKIVDGRFTSDDELHEFLVKKGVPSSAVTKGAEKLVRWWMNPREGTAYAFESVRRDYGESNYHKILELLEQVSKEPK